MRITKAIILFLFSFSPVSHLIANPLSNYSGFIENKGQLCNQDFQKATDINYVLLLKNMKVFLKNDGVSYELYNDGDTNINTIKYHRIDLKWLGINKNSTFEKGKQLPCKINYYTVCDPEGIQGVRSYEKITYIDVYPNIDIEFLLTSDLDKPFKYNYIVKPGGNSDMIKIQFNGAIKTNLNGKKIDIETNLGQLTEEIPVSYIQGFGNSPVQVRFKQIGAHTFGFEVNDYPGDQTLVIDPVPSRSWGTYFGGFDGEYVSQVDTDLWSNIYSVGSTASWGGIATSGAYQGTINALNDFMITKMDSTGQLIWATYYGGDGYDHNPVLSVTDSGDVYIAGRTSSTTGIATAGTHQTIYAGPPVGGGGDICVARFDSSGAMIWGSYFGGLEDDESMRVAVNNSGVYVVGRTNSISGIATPGAYQTSKSIGGDGIIVKFNTNGSLVWATYYGGTGHDNVTGIEFDGNGNLHLSGGTSSTSGFSTTGAYQVNNAGGYDAFYSIFSSNGVRQYSTFYGGPGDDHGHRVRLDASGHVYFLGSTGSSTGIATVGAWQTVHYGSGTTGFILKFTPTMQRIFGSYVNGVNVFDMELDINNNIYLAGDCVIGCLSTIDGHQTGPGGDVDGTFGILDSVGNYLYGTLYGGSAWEGLLDIHISPEGGIIICGGTSSTSMISTPNAHQPNYNWNSDGFIVKFTGFNNSIPTGLFDYGENGIIIYPNPTDKFIFLIPNNEEFISGAIYTINGILIRSLKIDNSNRKIDLSDLSSGIYLLNMVSESGNFVKKIVKR